MNSCPTANAWGSLVSSPYFEVRNASCEYALMLSHPKEFLRPPERRREIVTTAAKLGMVHEKQVLSHVDQIESVVQGLHIVSGAEEVEESWRRCTAGYRLNPSSRSAPNVLTDSELRVPREAAGGVISYAQEELDRLYAILREAGYVRSEE